MENDNPHSLQLTGIASESCITLPAEIIYHIFRFVDPQDLIRLQAVSKAFQAIVRDPVVWRTIYSSTRLPLPPGPFTWQSVHFLQRALVYSARLARIWTTEPLTLISSKTYIGPRTIEKDRFRWVAGRWLLVTKDMRQLRSRDTETGSEQVLWDQGLFFGWAVTSLKTPHAHLLYLVIHLHRWRLDDSVKLLEFVINDDTGYMSGPDTFDVPTRSLPRESYTARMQIRSGFGPYAYLNFDASSKPRNTLIFDPQRRQFYKFPRFRTRQNLLLNYRGAWLPHLVEVYYTETHVFVLSRSYLIHGNLGEVELMQTFTFPDIDSDPDPSTPQGQTVSRHVLRKLRLTHELLTRGGPRSVWLVPMRDSTVDPVTGATTLRFMHTYAPFEPTPDSRVLLECTDYVLPAPPPLSPSTVAREEPELEHVEGNDGMLNRSWNTIVRSAAPVLPITVVAHDIFSVRGVWRGNLVDASHDGFMRGLCMVSHLTLPSDGGRPIYTDVIHKFTVDATGEGCIPDVGEPCPPWAELEPTRYYEYTFDGMRSRISFTKWDVLENNLAGQPVDRDVLAVVVDFK